MALKGKRIKLERWIHARACVVRLEVDAIILDSDPSEPCLEPDVLRFLDEVQRHADAGEIDVLSRLGEVYVKKSA